MSYKELESELARRGIPGRIVSVGSDRNETYCIVRTFGRWHVYYSERGHRRLERLFSDEHAAFEYLVGWILADHPRGFIRSADTGIDQRHRENERYCLVCGFEPGFLPWGVDGRTPTFDCCPCCGVQWGVGDTTTEEIRVYRGAWLRNGARWHDEATPQDGLQATDRLQRLSTGGEQPVS